MMTTRGALMMLQVAAAVAKAAWDSGVSTLPAPPNDWQEYIAELMWWPEGDHRRP
jgi:hypothetical protein